MISRRAFIGVVAGGLAVASAAASAQPAKKVARSGLTVPPSLLARADEVIQG
ncbi:MAG TPA: hypothetical protein VFK70_02355 [Vicinamibacteria bacterium]|nr:hypothetical protein [Vicinamibacteria bacterium]